MWPRWCARAILPRATHIYDSSIRGGQRETIRKELVIDHSNLTMKDVDRSAIAGWSASGCDPPLADDEFVLQGDLMGHRHEMWRKADGIMKLYCYKTYYYDTVDGGNPAPVNRWFIPL